VSEKTFNVLFLCTGNSARSVMAESIINRVGGYKFKGFSAGSHPKGFLLPEVVDFLKRSNYDVASLRSKSWEEFAVPGAPEMDFVFTVCDHAANEVCPIWPGHPMTAHWGVPDPAEIQEQGAERGLKLAEIYRMLYNRISIFVNLRMESLDKLALKKRLDDIGKNNE